MYEELVKKIRHCATDPMHCLSCGEDKDGRCFKRLMTQAADAIEKLCGLCASLSKDCSEAVAKYLELWAKQPRWISVEERLPDVGERVLCYCRANIFEVLKMRTDGKWVQATNAVDVVYLSGFVTHWMPLPEQPEEE